MERLSLHHDEVEEQRERALLSNASMMYGIDHYFTEPDDIPQRNVVSTVSAVKLYDDIQMPDGRRFRVVAPAAGRERVTVYGVGELGPALTSVDVRLIVDRAPIDPFETPMPVVAPPATPDEGGSEEITPEYMAALRLEAFNRIDARSKLLFASGFVFMDVILSLSLEAQVRYGNMMGLRDVVHPGTGAPILPYPITFSSLDDTTTVTISVPDEVQWLYLTAVARVSEIVASGNEQKNYIRDELRTAQELVDYVDSRALPSVIPVEPGGRPANNAAMSPGQDAVLSAPVDPDDLGDATS